MIRADFHIHSIASKDSLTQPEEILAWAKRRRLDRVVVTDHNSISGALAAYALDPELVIVGEEIMTSRGEILAAYVTEEVPQGLSPEEAIRRLRDQGAFISVSHPLDGWRNGAWKLEHLQEIAPLVDAIEIFNARCLMRSDNKRARDFALQHNLPGTAGSDAHAAFEIGAACLVLSTFNNADELRKVIRQGRVEGRLSPYWVHFFSRFARIKKKVV